VVLDIVSRKFSRVLHDNLWWRLIAFHILCIVVCTVGVSTWANKNLSGQELIKNNLELVDYVTSLEYVLKHSTSALNSDFIKQYILVSSKYKQYRVTLINEMGEVLLDTDYDVKVMDNHGSRPEIIRAKEKGDAWIKRYSQTLNQQMIYYVKQSFQQQYSPIYIRVSQSVTYIDLALKKLNTTFVLLMLFVILIVIILDVLMINYIHKQLGSLSDRAIELSKSDTSKRIYEQYEKPFRRLADAMNSMARKNERRIQEINKEKNQLSVVLSSLVEGVIAVDSEYKILHVNQSAGEMLGVDFKDADESNNLLFMHVRYPALINVIDKARQRRRRLKGNLLLILFLGKK
jgi:two-component system, OmpR family, phosphate regulon sensor histidine kinase PhoR